jgi:serine/threonine-protein kinase
MIGQTIAHYKITEKLGEGGMGVVYKAEDTKLDRTVALKFLAGHLLNDDEAKARFLREAKAAAALDHPNICTVYEIGEAEGKTFLSMAFIEGEPLEAPIERGPLSLKEALDIGRQIADGLEAAHEKRVIHRDIKPANVMVDAKGRATIMDFGLARLTEASRLTKADQTMGTVAYMSPEQAQGAEVDNRSDIWALGVVLYEMVAGVRPFKGEYDQALLYEVVHEEPEPLTSIRTGVPMELEVFVRKCLAKDPADRYGNAGETAKDLRMLADKLKSGRSTILRTEKPRGDTPTTTVARQAGTPPRTWLWPSVAAVLAVIAAAWAIFTLRPEPATAPVRFSIPLPEGQELKSAPAISKDGRIIAFAAERGAESQLYLRHLDSFETRTVAGSAGAEQPFFSPNGKWVGFFAQGRLKKVEVSGGTPIDVTEASLSFGGTWAPDDTIIYAASLGSGLLRVPAGGGAPERLTEPDDAEEGYAHVFPQVLPGGGNVLFGVSGKTQGTAVLSLDTGQWEMTLPSANGSVAIFESTGGSKGRLLVTDQASGIRAAPFDAAHPAPTSADALILTDVYYHVERDAMGWLAVSDNGTAVFAPGNPAKTSVVWVNRNGTTEAVGAVQDVYREVALSPGGTKAVVRQARDLWIHDLQRGTRSPLTRATNFNMFPLWHPNGEEVIFGSNRSGNWDLYSKPADASRPAEVLLSRPYDLHPSAVLADGTVLYFEMHPETGWDLWTLSPGEPSQKAAASPFRVTAFNEMDAQISPAREGGPRWIAYTSDESGRNEIYVESYPSGAKRMAVSTDGGFSAKWSRDGSELFYTSREAVFAVPVRPDGSLGASRRLFDWKRQETDRFFRSYDTSPDGKRFLMIRRDPGSVPRQLNVILNWSDES